MECNEPWSIRTLADGHWVRRDFGRLSILVLRRYEEWRIVALEDVCKDLPASGSADDLPVGLEFQRWDNAPGDRRFRFRPCYPPLPVVAKPTTVLHLSPGGEASFFIGVPAWIEVVAECQGEMIPLLAFPTEELSKTWHGNESGGRLGFALKTFARRVFDAHVWPDQEIICPIHVVNDGESMLPFDRLCLDTDHLSIFEHNGRLWSNAARIRHQEGDGGAVSITYGSRPAKPYEDSVEVTVPRKGKVRQSMMKSAFARMMGNFNLMNE